MIAAEYLGEMATASAGAMKGGSIHMLMVAVHFITFPVGSHTAEPQTPFRFISQIYSVLQLLSEFKHFRPSLVLSVQFFVPTLERGTILYLFDFLTCKPLIFARE